MMDVKNKKGEGRGPGTTPCRQGVSCSDAQLELLGFLSIPMLSLLAFVAAAVLLIFVHRSASE